jgi:adenylate kinase family enzyme
VVELLSSFGLSHGQPVGLDDLEAVIAETEKSCANQLEDTRKRISEGCVEFLDLAEMYPPLTEVLGPAGGLSQEMAYLVRSCHFEEVKTPFGVKHSFHLELEFFASVGDRFAAVKCQEQVGWWRGTRSTSSLLFRPVSPEVKERLHERGALYAGVATGQRFLSCRPGAFLTGRRFAGSIAGGRVMVDVAAAMESGQKPVLSGPADAAPNALEVQTEYYRKAVRQGRLEKKDAAVQRDEAGGVLVIDRMVFFDCVPTLRFWNCWPIVLGFSFTAKIWGYCEVGGLSPIIWADDAWDALVLPRHHKTLLQAVVRKQHAIGSIDVIRGKGEGATFLLYGPPGTGKTLTAEAMAEMLHKPLYVLSAGDMGTTPKELEETLSLTLHLCARWDCLCLIDEADIFLEQRSGSDVLRNALVCVMLRQLEYHNGVLFLTSNRISDIDAAVQSRLTLALRYEPLDVRGRQEVWNTLLSNVETDTQALDTGVLARTALNGRQIKNCVRLSVAVALNEGIVLSQDVLESTMESVCAFQRYIGAF